MTNLSEIDRSKCIYFDENYCSRFGCYAQALLRNLRDEGFSEQAKARAQGIIDEAEQYGCPDPLQYPLPE